MKDFLKKLLYLFALGTAFNLLIGGFSIEAPSPQKSKSKIEAEAKMLYYADVIYVNHKAQKTFAFEADADESPKEVSEDELYESKLLSRFYKARDALPKDISAHNAASNDIRLCSRIGRQSYPFAMRCIS